MEEIKLKSICSMLREVKKLASHASLTGSFNKSTPVLVNTYNKCLSQAKVENPSVEEFFAELSVDGTHLDEVGAAAGLLASYLCPSTKESFHMHGGCPEE